MKENVKVNELVNEIDKMKKAGTLLAGGDVTQEDLAIQIKGIIMHVATKDMDIKKDRIIDELSNEFVQVMLRADSKSEILKLYNHSCDSFEGCARKYLKEKLEAL